MTFQTKIQDVDTLAMGRLPEEIANTRIKIQRAIHRNQTAQLHITPQKEGTKQMFQLLTSKTVQGYLAQINDVLDLQLGPIHVLGSQQP